MSHRKTLPGLNETSMKRYLKSFLAIFVALTTSVDLKADDTCQVIFDAGSSGTRLYVYEHSNGVPREVYADPIEVDIGISWALEKKQCGETSCTDEHIKKVVADLIREFQEQFPRPHVTPQEMEFPVEFTVKDNRMRAVLFYFYGS